MADKRFVAKNGLDNNNQTITNVAPPVNSTDVSTKAFSSDASNLTTGTIPADRVPSSLILDKTLTGYAVGADAVLAATDTFVQAFGKLQAQINARLTGNQTITVSGDATGSGATAITLTLANSGVSAGTYGSSTAVPVLTVDGKGRVTGVSTASISGSLTFTGDVTGTGTTGSSTTLTLANTGVAAGTYTKVTVDAKGRVTSATTLASGDLPTYTGTLTSGQVTAALGFTPENVANKGQANGYASLDAGGKVPAAQLPSYVDDVLEYANLAAFPGTGETGKIYVTLDTNKVYRWSGSAYVEISPSPGTTDSLLEGSTNLYFTNTRARNAISVSGSLSYNATTGTISYTQPTNVSTFTNDSGYITSSALSPYLTTSTASSTYLPLAGGTISAGSDYPLILNTTQRYVLWLRNTSSTGTGWWLANDGGSLIFHANGVGDLASLSSAGTFNATNLTSGGNQVLHAGNYNSYSPTLTGTGASGTWAINITGNAATATSATDSTKLPLAGGTVTGFLQAAGGSKITVQNGTDGGTSRGIMLWTDTDSNWGIYMAQSGAGKSLSGGTAPASIDGRTAHAVRFRAYGSDAIRAFIWENDLDQCVASLSPDNGNFYTRGQLYATTNQYLVLNTGNYGSYALPISGGTLTGRTTFPSAVADRPQFPAGILGLDTGDGNFDIWGISREYYPSHATAGNAWGIRWDGDSNQIRFIGAGTVRLAIDLDGGASALTWEDNAVLHAGNYNSYSPTLTGTGASGTWGINISGNAATATSATDSTKLPLAGGTLTGKTRITADWAGGGITPFEQFAIRGQYASMTLRSTNADQVWLIHNDGTLSLYGASDGVDSVNWGRRAYLTNAGAFYVNEQLALTAGNYSSYALPLSNGTASSVTLGSRTNSSGYGGNTSGLSGYSFPVEVRANGAGPALSWHYENVATRHIALESSGALNVLNPGETGGAVLQVGGNTVLHAGNYNSYSPTLTGTGASGTWGINVTGNAGTITNQANSATITASTGVDANNIVRRDGNGYIYANHVNFNTGIENPDSPNFITDNGDGWSRKSSLAHVKNQIRGIADGTWGINITGNAGSATTASAAGYADYTTYYFNQNLNLNDVNVGNRFGAYNAYYPSGGSYNQPIGGGQHFRVIQFGGYAGGDASNVWRGQIAQSFYDDQMWFRKEYSTTWGSWREFLHSGNYGSYAVPLSGGTMTGDLTVTRIRGVNSLVLNSYATVNPASNVFLYSQPNDRDAWLFLDSADTGSNWGIYHRQIDSEVSGLPANSIGFVGGGASGLQAYISLANGNANFAGALTQAGNQVLHAGNYNNYSPTLVNGVGASGTWGINVTGTAGSISGYNNPTTAATANTIAYRDASGDISVREIVLNSAVSSSTPTVLVSMFPSSNQLVRTTPAAVAAAIRGAADGTWSINITGNAATATSAGTATTAGSVSSISSAQVVNALGFTPYPDSTSNGYSTGDISGSGTHQRLWGTDSIQDMFAFNPPTTVEYSTDGNTWTATSISSGVFDGKIYGKWGGFNANVGNNIGAWRFVRMTWVNFGYRFFSHFTLAHSTNGHSFNFVFYKSNLSGVFGAEAFRQNGISSWPGYTFTKHQNESGWWDTRDIRVVFELNYNPSYPDNAINIGHIGLMGSYGGFIRAFDWDGSRNMYFANAFITGSNHQVLHAGNYNNYSPTLVNGVGASGTWPISISGNAATASSAGYASSAGSAGTASSASSAGVATGAYYQYATTTSNNWNQSFYDTPAHATSFREMSGNGPSGAWWFVQNFRHSNSSDNWGTQLAWGWEDNANNLYQRNVSGSNWGSWVRYLNSANYSSYALPLGGGTVTGTATFSRTDDNAISVGTIRGRAVGVQTGDYIHMYERVHIGGPNGWGASNATAPTQGLGVFGSIHVSIGNATGGGIILADDGDIVDLNDAYCSMRFSYGVRIYSANRGGNPVIALRESGNIIANGDVTAYGSASDIRLKENLAPVSEALAKVLALKGYYFNYIGRSDRMLGVVAQEIQTILPEVVYEYDNQETGGKNLAVRYENIVPLLIEAIKEQQAEIVALRDEVRAMREA